MDAHLPCGLPRSVPGARRACLWDLTRASLRSPVLLPRFPRPFPSWSCLPSGTSVSRPGPPELTPDMLVPSLPLVASRSASQEIPSFPSPAGGTDAKPNLRHLSLCGLSRGRPLVAKREHQPFARTCCVHWRAPRLVPPTGDWQASHLFAGSPQVIIAEFYFWSRFSRK